MNSSLEQKQDWLEVKINQGYEDFRSGKTLDYITNGWSESWKKMLQEKIGQEPKTETLLESVGDKKIETSEVLKQVDAARVQFLGETDQKVADASNIGVELPPEIIIEVQQEMHFEEKINELKLDAAEQFQAISKEVEIPLQEHQQDLAPSSAEQGLEQIQEELAPLVKYAEFFLESIYDRFQKTQDPMFSLQDCGYLEEDVQKLKKIQNGGEVGAIFDDIGKTFDHMALSKDYYSGVHDYNGSKREELKNVDDILDSLVDFKKQISFFSSGTSLKGFAVHGDDLVNKVMYMEGVISNYRDTLEDSLR